MLKGADVTSDRNLSLLCNLTGRNDIEVLQRTLPVVEDIKDYAIPEFFQTDEEFEDFQRMLEADRQADCPSAAFRLSCSTLMRSRASSGGQCPTR